MGKSSGPGVQHTWVLAYNPVLKIETKTATTFSTSKNYCENLMRLCIRQCFVNLI